MNTAYLAVTPHGCEICHMGVKGMKWGVRKGYETKDGQLTDKGKAYRDEYRSKRSKALSQYYDSNIRAYQNKIDKTKRQKTRDKYEAYKKYEEQQKRNEMAKSKNMSLEDIHKEKKYKQRQTAIKTVAGAATATAIMAASYYMPIDREFTQRVTKRGIMATTAINLNLNAPLTHIYNVKTAPVNYKKDKKKGLL